MSQTLVLCFDYVRGSVATRSALWSPCPPFNSGTWSFNYDPIFQSVRVKCSGVTDTVAVESVKLMTTLEASQSPLHERVADSELSQAPFPPTANWSLDCDTIPGVFTGPDCVAKLVVVYATSQLELDHRQDQRTGSTAGSDYASIADTDSLPDNADADDSDDETDAIPLASCATRTDPSLPSNVTQVVVRSAAYTTYRAILYQVKTNTIAFAALSSRSLLSRTSGPARSVALLSSLSTNPAGPLPASPKSVYKLASSLGLVNLAERALWDYKAQLTAGNVLCELFGGMGGDKRAHEALVAFAVANWGDVRQTATFREFKQPEVLAALPNVTEAVGRLIDLLIKAVELNA